MNCFICKEKINDEPILRGEFHFHPGCIEFKSKLTRQQQRQIIRNVNKSKRYKQVSGGNSKSRIISTGSQGNGKAN